MQFKSFTETTKEGNKLVEHKTTVIYYCESRTYLQIRLHGWSDGGRLHKIRLYDGDKIVKVKGTRGIGPGATVDSLTFYTSK